MNSDTNPAAGPPASSAESERAGGLASSAIVRTQRALQILRILQAGQVWSAAELAAQFDCSTRTIFRDLQLLRECGIPIDSPRGERGFKLSHDFFWQPERPTLEEMIALVVGARLAGDAMPKEMARSLDSAVAKLVGSEKPAVRQRLTQLNLRIDAPHMTPHGALPEVEFLQLLLEHIVAQSHVRLVLVGNSPTDVPQILEVIPVRLHFVGDQWQLVTTAWEGGAEQTLPLSHIERVESPPGAAPRDYVPEQSSDERIDADLADAGLPAKPPVAEQAGGEQAAGTGDTPASGDEDFGPLDALGDEQHYTINETDSA